MLAVCYEISAGVKVIFVNTDIHDNTFCTVCVSHNGKCAAIAFCGVIAHRATENVNGNVVTVRADVNTTACTVHSRVVIYRAAGHFVVAVVDNNTAAIARSCIIGYATSGNLYVATVNKCSTATVFCSVRGNFTGVYGHTTAAKVHGTTILFSGIVLYAAAGYG